MKLNRSCLVIFFSIFTCLQARHNFNQLILTSINPQYPSWAFAYTSISQSYDGSFAQLTEKWQKIIESKWSQFDDLIIESTHVTVDDLYSYLNHEIFIAEYMDFYQSYYPNVVTKQYYQEINPLVLNYLDMKMQYFECYKSIQFNQLFDISGASKTFGSDYTKHYFIINQDIYNQKNIRTLYDVIQEKIIKYEYFPSSCKKTPIMIESIDIFNVHIAQAISMIMHQSDYFIKALQFFVYENNEESNKIISYGVSYILFLSYLEATLQSKNPYETAIYLQLYCDNLHSEFNVLWQELIQDLKNCYDTQDFATYESFIKDQYKIILFS